MRIVGFSEAVRLPQVEFDAMQTESRAYVHQQRMEMERRALMKQFNDYLTLYPQDESVKLMMGGLESHK